MTEFLAITFVFCVIIAVIFLGKTKMKSALASSTARIKDMTDNNDVPEFSPIEQAKFILNMDDGYVFSRLGVKILDHEHIHKFITIDQKIFRSILESDEIVNLLSIDTNQDGLWICSDYTNLTLVEQERGRRLIKQYESKKAMFDALMDYYGACIFKK